MKAFVAVFVGLLVTSVASANPIFRIEVGKDYRRYSNSDLQERVWRLEHAVQQLQQRIFQIEASNQVVEQEETWICTVTSGGQSFSGTGATKAVAMNKTMENCSAKADSFFCRDPKCTQ